MISEVIEKGARFVIKWPVNMRLELTERDDKDWPSVICKEGFKKYIGKRSARCKEDQSISHKEY